MRLIELEENIKKVNTPHIISVLQSIEFLRGKTFDLPKMKKTNRLHAYSKRKSTTSSNAIEGIKVSKLREKELLDKGMDPSTYEDHMVVGYNKALEYIFDNYDEPLTVDFICRLHSLMYSSFNPEFGGRFKQEQNYIKEINDRGEVRIVFTPVSPRDTSNTMENLVYQYQLCASNPFIPKLLLIPVFILDFLCIHPFDDGNGRVSRLLTTYLLTKFDYKIDQYYSLSYVVLNTIDEYYKSLEKSDHNWKEGNNDYSYFVIYFLKTIVNAYKKLDYIIDVNNEKLRAIDKVYKVIKDNHCPTSKSDIEEVLYLYSRNTIEASLKSLVKDNKIRLIQKGHYSLYKIVY